MIKTRFSAGEKAILIVYLPKVQEVEVIEQAKYLKTTKIKYCDVVKWVDTCRLRKI